MKSIKQISIIYISTLYQIYGYIDIYIYIDMKSIKQIRINKIVVLILVILLFNESYNQGNLNLKLKRDNHMNPILQIFRW